MSTRTIHLSVLLLLAMLAGSASADLVAQYKFDGNADDSVGHNDGTPSGDPTYGPGRFGQAMHFDGVNDYVAIPPFRYTNEQGEFGLAFWFKAKTIAQTATNNAFPYMFNQGTGNKNNTTRVMWRSATNQLRTDSRLMDPDNPTNVTGATGIQWVYDIPSGPIVDGKWHLYTLTSSATQGGTIYIDGQVVGTNPEYKGNLVNLVDKIILGSYLGTSRYFGGPDPEDGLLDDLRFYNEALTQEAIQEIMAANSASRPSPANQATDVARNVVLSWMPGQSAGTHDVYFGTTAADVAAAGRGNPLGVLVGQAQAETTYDPAGLLALDQTYFWRIDEIAADGTLYAGPVWSFTAEPHSLAITAITATASSSDAADVGPDKTVDGSGLGANDQHSTLAEDMWLSSSGGPQPAWIQYAFDKAYKLHEMWVWNSNQRLETALGAGVRSVTVQYSMDGDTWTKLGDFELAQAPGQATYAHNTTVDFAGAAARYVKMTINSNWNAGGTLAQCGLSEVRFLAVPTSARKPSPAAGATNVAPATTLSWRAGREAATHDVYIGTDPAALARAATVAVPEYEAMLNLGTTYYWRVIEANAAEDPATWEGDLWSFSTQEYLVVDDFESYTNVSPNRVFQAWIDGAGFSADEFFPNGNPGNGTGSLVGYDPSAGDIMEKKIVHGGRQSMPIYYDNTDSGRSEAERTFAGPQDWTEAGVKTLTLYFQGDPNNTGQLYVKINGTKTAYSGPAEDIVKKQWLPWTIDLMSLPVNLEAVTKIGIGVDGAGASGTVYIDDIRLYP